MDTALLNRIRQKVESTLTDENRVGNEVPTKETIAVNYADSSGQCDFVYRNREYSIVIPSVARIVKDPDDPFKNDPITVNVDNVDEGIKRMYAAIRADFPKGKPPEEKAAPKKRKRGPNKPKPAAPAPVADADTAEVTADV